MAFRLAFILNFNIWVWCSWRDVCLLLFGSCTKYREQCTFI